MTVWSVNGILAAMSPRSADANQQMRDSSRRAILDAAAQVFGEIGPHLATTAVIAQRAGVAKGLVFAHFATKDALLEAVIESRLIAALEYWHELPPAPAGAALLTDVANRAIDRAIADREAFRLYYALFFQPDTHAAIARAATRIKPQLQAYYAMLARALRASGSTDPAVDAVLFQAALNGLVQNVILQPELLNQPKLFPRKKLVTRLVAAFAGPGRRRGAPSGRK